MTHSESGSQENALPDIKVLDTGIAGSEEGPSVSKQELLDFFKNNPGQPYVIGSGRTLTEESNAGLGWGLYLQSSDHEFSVVALPKEGISAISDDSNELLSIATELDKADARIGEHQAVTEQLKENTRQRLSNLVEGIRKL